MKATELIGRNAIRTAPTKATGNRSYTDTPIFIITATDTHIVYRHVREIDKKIFGTDAKVLGCDWADDNWTSYDDLIKEPSNAIREVKCPAKIGDYIKVITGDGHYVPIGTVGKVIRFGTYKKTWVYIDSYDSLIRDDQYVVLENYKPEEPKPKTLADYSIREIARELVRRYKNA